MISTSSLSTTSRPTSAGGHPTDLDNLVCSCAICNGLKDRAIVDSPDAARALIEGRKRRRLADYREARRQRRRTAVRRLAAVLFSIVPFVPLDRPADSCETRRENVVIPG